MTNFVTDIEQLEYKGTPIVVCFTNPLTCAPCKVLKPHFNNAAQAMGVKADFVEVNVLDHMDIAAEFGVMGTPTIILINGDEHVNIEARTSIPLITEIDDLL